MYEKKDKYYSKHLIHPCHTAAILSRETKKALFYHAKPRNENHGDEAQRGKTKLFWSPGGNMAIWPPGGGGYSKNFWVWMCR